MGLTCKESRIMSTAEIAHETSILAELSALGTSFESRLLQRVVWLAAAPFILTLILDIAAILFIGVPQGQLRLALPGLFDPLYQTFVLTVAITAWNMRTFFRTVPYTFQRLAE